MYLSSTGLLELFYVITLYSSSVSSQTTEITTPEDTTLIVSTPPLIQTTPIVYTPGKDFMYLSW